MIDSQCPGSEESDCIVGMCVAGVCGFRDACTAVVVPPVNPYIPDSSPPPPPVVIVNPNPPPNTSGSPPGPAPVPNAQPDDVQESSEPDNQAAAVIVDYPSSMVMGGVGAGLVGALAFFAAVIGLNNSKQDNAVPLSAVLEEAEVGSSAFINPVFVDTAGASTNVAAA